MASVVSAADWDGDGALDLIVGNITGGVYLIRNEGTPQAYAFGAPQALTTADGTQVHVASRAGPCVADWDGDGDLDLLVGADDGSVSLYRNLGTKTAARLAPPLQLVTPGERSSRDQVPQEARHATRSKLCVADWNNDGKPDLFVGDFVSQKAARPEPTPEERAQQDRIRKELEPLLKERNELIAKYRGADREDREKLVREITELDKKMRALQAQLPRDYEMHGWVWLFLRR